MGIPRSELTDGVWMRLPDGTYERPTPEPFYYGLFPWAWKRLIGWRDAQGRKAQFIGWEGSIMSFLFESWGYGL